MTIFGQRLTIGQPMDVKDPARSIESGASKGADWYKDKENPSERKEAAFNVYDKPNPFADFDISGWLLNYVQSHANHPRCTATTNLYFPKITKL